MWDEKIIDWSSDEENFLDKCKCVNEVISELIYKKIKVMYYDNKPSKSQLVGGSKLLHHLLPDLVPPMDRRNTVNYFYKSSSTSKSKFKNIFCAFCKIAKGIANEVKENLKKYVYDFSGENSFEIFFDEPKEEFKPIAVSLPKLVDDLIIAHQMKNNKNENRN